MLLAASYFHHYPNYFCPFNSEFYMIVVIRSGGCSGKTIRLHKLCTLNKFDVFGSLSRWNVSFSTQRSGSRKYDMILIPDRLSSTSPSSRFYEIDPQSIPKDSIHQKNQDYPMKSTMIDVVQKLCHNQSQNSPTPLLKSSSDVSDSLQMFTNVFDFLSVFGYPIREAV